MSEFGKEIRRLREAAGMSMPDLARAADIGSRTIASFELEGDAPKIISIVRLARALRVSPYALAERAIRDVVAGEK